ncbi:MAG: DNA polymerase IV [Gammaproteobacteria bacterium]|nr:DNA polymerase IV [Gammaproteobacteria bacterium]
MKWERAIILVDMDCFFAAVEQLDFPKLRDKPVAVTNGEQGTCIITSSYEARKYGIKTGMRLKEARKLCPSLIQSPSRTDRYIEISNKIMEALQAITPDIEIFSIDEAFLDITNCLHLYKTPSEAARKTQKIIYDVSGLSCSIGLSADKTTAKYAAKLKKPSGLVVIPPWEIEKTLANVKVTELCGIGENIGKFLARYGVIYCQDMAKIPISILAKRFGNVGRRIWLMCQGKDPEPVHTTIIPPKSIGHGKLLPPNTLNVETIKNYFLYMTEKVAARLRSNNMYAENFFIGMLNKDWKWIAIKYSTLVDTNDGKQIYLGCEKLLKEHPYHGVIRQVQITALNPQTNLRQLSLFDDTDTQENTLLLNLTIDNINQKFGNNSITKAALLNKSKIPDVIPWASNSIKRLSLGHL